MESELIIIHEYCEKSHIEPDFLLSLEEGGLIDIQRIDGEQYLLATQLSELEKYCHFYYDLSINIEGIDVIHNLLERIEALQKEVTQLHKHLHSFRNYEKMFPLEDIESKTI